MQRGALFYINKACGTLCKEGAAVRNIISFYKNEW